jgi:hypothetical protein
MDLPVFVDVSSIVSGYSMQTGVTVNGTLSSEKAIQGNYLAAGGQAIYTDAAHEWAYDRQSHIGQLDKGLDEAKAKGWTVVSMKDDWQTIFPPANK